ncbi:TY-Chap domain-containing protein, partial [Nocardioides sp.]|uniref:TY-Chap domain-containing protein n=1 Tax=Nocardioides sp. TaxID=35761 RepID=UPI002D80D3CE
MTEDLEASAELAWREFRQRLADRLAAAEEDDILLVEVEAGVADDDLHGAAPYAQFVGWGEGMLRAEVVSNVYLDERFGLTADDERVLTDMGWSEPAYDDDGDPVAGEANFHLDAPVREADRVAVLAVRALREVFGCPHPAFLAADGLEPVSVAAAEPARADGEVELAYPDDVDHLQSLVDAALEVMF